MQDKQIKDDVASALLLVYVIMITSTTEEKWETSEHFTGEKPQGNPGFSLQESQQ